MASVPNALGQPSVKFTQMAREHTTTGPNAHRLMQFTAMPFSRAHLLAFYPLDRGKVIHAVSEVLLKGIRYHMYMHRHQGHVLEKEVHCHYSSLKVIGVR